MKKFILSLIIISFSLQINAQTKRAMTVEDMWSMKRIGGYDLSPDGKKIVFSITTYDMKSNKGNSDIWMIDSDGKNLKPIKNSDANESSPKFSPNGMKITYETGGQIWIADPNGNNASKLTDLYTGASGIAWAKDGRGLLFISSVYPDCLTQECNKKRDEEAEESKIKAKIFTELMYRHWNDWRGDKRSHLYWMNYGTKEYFDVTLTSNFDVPPIALGSANDYSLSPDGEEIAFTMNTDKMLATSTNNDIFILRVSDINKNGKTNFKQISTSKGNDNQPVYSPDGKYIAFCSMARAGFEADKQSLMIYNRETGELKNVTNKLDISIGQILWSPDAKFIYFDADRESFHSIYKFNLATGENTLLVKDGHNSELTINADGTKIFFKRQQSILPTEIFSINNDGTGLTKITNTNPELLAQLQFGEFDTFWSKGAGGVNVQSIIVKPPFFDAAKKYPMIFLIHGGPQGNWSDQFHYRWNMQLFASKGYVVVAPNPRGSTGFGQKFTDEISGDWGGKVYVDLMNTYDNAIKSYKFIDAKNTFAAGGSYGGYMVNWILANNTKFNALVAHASVFNLESMYGATEELWFPEWENKGTPWQNRKLYEKFSPHRYAKNFKTPTLVIHGAYDFRVPEGQAFELFTTLQRMNVPSKFLYYTDETHFVTKPQNAKLWWNTIFDWFDQFKK